MPDKSQQKHRANRVFKSLHKPLTYLGVERTLFYFVCVGAVGAFSSSEIMRRTFLSQLQVTPSAYRLRFQRRSPVVRQNRVGPRNQQLPQFPQPIRLL